MALQHLMVPAALVLQNKKKYKPTIEKSKTCLFRLVDDKSNMDAFLTLSLKDRQTKKLEIYPMIFGIGESNSTISEFVLTFKGIAYSFNTIIEALDTAFKCYVFFNISFSPEHKRFWALLNGLFYKIKCKLEITSAISSIINSFEI